MIKTSIYTQYEILLYMWAKEEPLTFAQIFHYCTIVREKDWQRNKVNKYLTDLIQNKFIKKEERNNSYFFEQTISECEFKEQVVTDMLRRFLNFFNPFAVPLYDDIAEDEMEQIRILLEDRPEDKE